MALEALKASLAYSVIVKRGEYEYMVHPITDGIPSVDPAIINEISTAMLEIGNFDCDMIVTIEALGIPLVTITVAEDGETIQRREEEDVWSAGRGQPLTGDWLFEELPLDKRSQSRRQGHNRR